MGRNHSRTEEKNGLVGLSLYDEAVGGGEVRLMRTGLCMPGTFAP